MMLLVTASSMMAQMRATYLNRACVFADPADIKAEPGKTCELVIYIKDNVLTEDDGGIRGYMFALELPKGISMEIESYINYNGETRYRVSEEIYEVSDLHRSPSSFSGSPGMSDDGTPTGRYAFMWYPSSNTSLKSTNGELVRFTLNVASDFVGGTGKITNFNFVTTENTSETLYYQDTEFTFNGGENTDNVIYMDDVEVKAGTEQTLSLKMKNIAEIRGFQFTLDLPDGVTPVKSAKGKIQASLSTGRLADGDEHTLSVSENEDGTLLFTANSLYEETFTGNDGEVLTLRVNVDKDMADGDYDVIIKDQRLNEKDATVFYDVTKMKSTLTVWSFILGDVNGDGDIDVSDYIGVANRIHNVAQEGFIEKAADVVADGVINISDYVGVANIILTGNIHGTAAQARRSAKKANTDVSGLDNVLYVEPFTAEKGGQTVMSVKMKNTAQIRGFQFDLALPEGVTAVKSAKGKIQAQLSDGRLPEEDEHTLTVTQQADGTLRFLCGSEYEETFTGNDGEILTLTLDVAADLQDGIYPVVLSNIRLGENDMNVNYKTEAVETTLTIGNSNPEPEPEPEPEHTNGKIWGDVNNDGNVDVADIATIISIMADNARQQKEMEE